MKRIPQHRPHPPRLPLLRSLLRLRNVFPSIGEKPTFVQIGRLFSPKSGFLLSILIGFGLVPNLSSPLFSQNKETDPHKATDTASLLNRRILRVYEDLGAARELLKSERIESVPNGTYISFLGTYPNRTGIKVVKHSIQEGREGIERSESKSILLEFTGTTLSRVVTEIKAENSDGSDSTNIRLIDETPLDQNVDDIVVEAERNGKATRYPIRHLPDEGLQRERTNFKQEFYLKLMEDFLVQILRLQEMQNQESTKNKKKLLQTFKDSLQY